MTIGSDRLGSSDREQMMHNGSDSPLRPLRPLWFNLSSIIAARSSPSGALSRRVNDRLVLHRFLEVPVGNGDLDDLP